MTDSPLGGTVWEKLGTVILLLDVCPWGWAFRFQSFVLTDQGVSFQLLPWCHACVPAALLPAVKVMDSPTEQTLSRGKQIITGKAPFPTVATREHSGEWRGTGINEPDKICLQGVSKEL